MRAILVDDEVANLENLKILLDKHCPNIKVVASASNIDEAFAQVTCIIPTYFSWISKWEKQLDSIY